MAWGLIKPLGGKAYGSIPHLPGSRVGAGDHMIDEGQAIICTSKPRKDDLIIVQEKLDGSNCAVAKVDGELMALSRAGYRCTDSTYPIHKVFQRWFEENRERFDMLLADGERVCGEFLAMAVGTKYNLPHEPFVAFDIFRDNKRLMFNDMWFRANQLDFITPRILHISKEGCSIAKAISLINDSGHGAIDPVEGAVWRVEREGRVDFLAKYVHHHKQDGKYFSEISGEPTVWNIDVTKYHIY